MLRHICSLPYSLVPLCGSTSILGSNGLCGYDHTYGSYIRSGRVLPLLLRRRPQNPAHYAGEIGLHQRVHQANV